MSRQPGACATSPPQTDPSARVAGTQRQLRATLQRRDTLTALVRETLGEADPRRIADVLLGRLSAWVPLGGWTLVVSDQQGQLAQLVARGVADDLWDSALRVATLVLQQRTVFLSADVSRDPRFPGVRPATVVAFSLVARGQAVGAAIGVDAPSAREPRFSPAVLSLLAEVFDTAASTLGQAFQLQRAEAMSVTDELTGLYNSRYLKEGLHRESKRAMRYGRPVSVLFIDLDGFKGVNDTHGHLAGSRTLVEAGGLIHAGARESDIVARYGGDEFVMVLPDTGSEGAMVVARRIRDRIAGHKFLAADGINWRLTASLGVATLPDVAQSSEALLDAADRAMYHVKEHGKNNVFLAPRS
ncbi:MAG: GGDEF domain-containing protein [Vicinamibacterales bacterium]|nr:GGDEF domain-containing protein [Vicinamibacterales bacterium]